MSTFPSNIGDEIVTSIANAFPDFTVVRRTVRRGDPNKTFGLVSFDWTPDEKSKEINAGLGQEPTLQTYLIRMQMFHKHAQEEQGRADSTLDTKILRTVLYRDTDLQLRLAALSEELLGTVERLQRWGLRNQRFMNNQVANKQYVFLTQTDFWAETTSMTL